MTKKVKNDLLKDEYFSEVYRWLLDDMIDKALNIQQKIHDGYYFKEKDLVIDIATLYETW